jgi:hypothetical protein
MASAAVYVLAVDWTSDHNPQPFRVFDTEDDAGAWVDENPPGEYADYLLYRVPRDGQVGSRSTGTDGAECVCVWPGRP